MSKKNEIALSVLRMQLNHYKEKGVGEKSDLSKSTIITKRLIKNTFSRYVELGGSLDFLSDLSEEEEVIYKDFMEEVIIC